MVFPLKELLTKGRHATRPAGVAREEQQSQTEENQAGVGHCMVYVGLSPDKAGPMVPGVSPPMSPSLNHTAIYSDFLVDDSGMVGG